MVQYIKQGDIFGRVGSGIGKGLAEQLPEEVTRGRLATGLKNLAAQEGQSPFQQFAGLASIPGATPQIIQSGGELLRQQGIAQGFRNVRDQTPQTNPLRQPVEPNATKSHPQTGLQSQPKGLVNPETTQRKLNPYIPKNREQLLSRAADLYDQNRQLYPNPESAMSAAVQEDQQEQAISNAEQAANQSSRAVEDRVRGELQGLRKAANVQIPDNVYQKVENDILDKIEKGAGELEAVKEGQNKLDELSRDYSKIDSFGNYTLLGSNPKEVRRSVSSLKQKFAKNEDSENLADALVARVGLSNEYGHFLANEIPQPIQKFVNNNLDAIPEFMAKNIGPMLGKNDSPLAIAHLLSENTEINSGRFKKYLIDHAKEFNLSQSQVRELEKVDSIGQGYLNDLWLKAFGGP